MPPLKLSHWCGGLFVCIRLDNCGYHSQHFGLLTKLGWDGGFISEEIWTILMIFAAVVINLLIILKRNMREFAMVGVWALVAIYIRHKQIYPVLPTAHLVAGNPFYCFGNSRFKNRATSPVEKCKERWVSNN
ncbi:hypothetical protein Q2T40_20920 [Winogradskyella maritima]|nr:hypothetical protein [Winogradskyella maritima]